jgi:hypothetical protein
MNEAVALSFAQARGSFVIVSRLGSMRIGLALLSSAIFVGCDPGWRYHLAPHPAAASATKAEPIRVELVSASVFSLGFDVSVEITNATASVVMIDSADLTVRDARNSSLIQEAAWGCTAAAGGRLQLSPAASCQVSSSFRVNPGTWRANRRLRTLLVRVAATVDGTPVTIILPLEWDL